MTNPNGNTPAPDANGEHKVAQLTVNVRQLQLLNFCMALVHAMRRKDARTTLQVFMAICGLIADYFDDCERINVEIQRCIEAMEPTFTKVEMDVTDGENLPPFPRRFPH